MGGWSYLDPANAARTQPSQCSSSGRTPTSWQHIRPHSRTTRLRRSITSRSPVITGAALPLFDPPPFQPSKLSVKFAPGTTSTSPSPPSSTRRYTLTHNDVTGQLWLTVGAEYNRAQISGFYTRLLRDEVVAEWKWGPEEERDSKKSSINLTSPCGGIPSLHLFCHVSGEERWLAPPVLRDYIFRREIPLVRGGNLELLKPCSWKKS